MKILLFILLLVLAIAIFRLLYSTEQFDPEFSAEVNGSRTYQDGYFTVTKYYQRDRIIAVKVESPKNDYALVAKKPYDPDDDSMEFYKMTKMLCTKVNLKYRIPQWNSEGLTRFMQRRMNAWAKKERNKAVIDPYVSVSDREAFKRIGNEVFFK